MEGEMIFAIVVLGAFVAGVIGIFANYAIRPEPYKYEPKPLWTYEYMQDAVYFCDGEGSVWAFFPRMNQFTVVAKNPTFDEPIILEVFGKGGPCLLHKDGRPVGIRGGYVGLEKIYNKLWKDYLCEQSSQAQEP